MSKNKKELEGMKQVHKIRKDMYEETKHMGPSEFLKYIKKRSAKVDKLRLSAKKVKNINELFAGRAAKKKAS